MREFRFVVLFLCFSIFFILNVNQPAYANMKPAKPDGTTTWDTNAKGMNSLKTGIRLFSTPSVSGPIIADISHFQGPINWSLASKSLDLAIIRTQSGSTVEDLLHKVNENGAIQYHVPFGVYAYNQSISTSDAKIEARDFYNRANKNTLFYAIDVEANTSLSGESMRSIINSYVAELRQKTNKKIGVYIANHLYQSLNIDTSKFDFVWIPKYNTTNTPPVYHYDLWQYTDQGRINGINTYVDLNRLSPQMPLSFFTNRQNVTVSSVPDPVYFSSNPKKIVILKTVYQYTSPDFNGKTRRSTITANHIVSVSGISHSPAGTPRLKLSNGYYITANTEYALKVISTIDQYYTSVPKQIIAKTGLYEYKSTNFTVANQKSPIRKNAVVNIAGIVYTASGTPRLKTTRGTYITANKSYVKAK